MPTTAISHLPFAGLGSRLAMTAVAILTIAPVNASNAQGSAFQSTCHRVAEVEATFFASKQTAAFDFTGSEAAKLGAAIDYLSGQLAVEPAFSMHLVVDLAVSDFSIFFFGADGCYTGMIAGLSRADVAKLFTLAGVAPPKTLQ